MSNFDLRQNGGATEFVHGLTGVTGLRMESKHGQVPNFDKVQFFDDFTGDVIDAGWNVVAGSDSPAAVAWSAVADGVIRITTGDSNASVAADGAVLNRNLIWKASSGNMVLQARVKVDVITSVKMFIGLTDTLSLEEPMNMTTTTLTTTASDAVGFFFDTAATAQFWQCAGVKGDTDTAVTTTTYAPVAATYQDFRIEVDSSGGALFFINGVQVASIANCVTTSVALTPVFYARASGNTTSKNMDVDYVYLSKNRT